ncbi:MAG: hypothetical protein QM784_18835 [Polyangiaceae bacterium]
MSSFLRNWLGLALGLTLGLVCHGAQASVPLCVTVRADESDRGGFEKLVRSEVARHPSHRIVEENCESHLVVEIFRAADTRYLTVQLEGEVPERATLAKEEEPAGKLAGAISAVLGTDPVHLAKDPSKWSALERARQSVLIRGMNTYRLELFESIMRTDENLAFAPGVGLGFARGADQWQIHARLHFAGSPAQISGRERALRLAAGLDVGLLYEYSRRAPTSGYFGAGFGAMLVRLEGLVNPSDRSTRTSVDGMGVTANLRAGIRFLRLYDFDTDLFTQVSLPLFATRETDDPLFGESGVYTPFLQLGVGIGF